MSRSIFIPGMRPIVAAATDLTRISDIVVPEIFSGYVQTLTQEKSRLVRSGALVVDPRLSSDLVGGGSTFNQPFYHDLDSSDGDHEENISSDSGNDSTPDRIQAGTEIQVRLSRNKSWGSADLAAALAGDDPMQAIANRVSDWRVRRLQRAWLSTMKGVFANNAAAPAASSTHEQNDLTIDISGSAYSEATRFTPAAYIAAKGTMGDSMDQLAMVMMHSVVYQRLMNLNLIDFIPDARGEVNIATYMGNEVIVDDGMPSTGGVYETWLFGSGATAMGLGSPLVPVAITRKEEANQGGGEEVLFNRWEWIIHPVGHAFLGTAQKGGPSNAATTGNLASAASWGRVFRERKQIRIARLITREHA